MAAASSGTPCLKPKLTRLTIISVRPPHPYLPGVVLVVAITLMVGFPYAAEELIADLRGVPFDEPRRERV